MATYPSLVMAQQLAEVVKVRHSALAVTLGQDANGDPTVAIGAGTAASESAFVRIKPRNANLFFDIKNDAQPAYGKPHVAQVYVEGTATSLGMLTICQKVVTTLIAELSRVGVRLELYVGPNTSAATLANLNTEVAAGNVDASWEDLFNPIASSM